MNKRWEKKHFLFKCQCIWHANTNREPGLPQLGKRQGKTKIFQGQGKSLILSKSVKSQGILFSGL